MKREIKFTDSKSDQLTKEEMQNLYYLLHKFNKQIIFSSEPDFDILNDISFVQLYLQRKCFDLYDSVIED